MKNRTLLLFTATLLGMAYISSSFINPTPEPIPAAQIKWLSWEEAIAQNKKKPKKIFIDVYTDWCGWCKRMDKSTFMDKDVVAYMNKNFYAVKLDAEQKEEVKFKNHTFKFVKNGRRGYHELAASLLNNRMSYPSYAFMNEKVDRITIASGYQSADKMLCLLHFIGKDKYTSISFQDFEKNWKKK